MTTTFYASVNDVHSMLDVAHAGTSSTSTDVVEIRMGNGTYAPTRNEVMLALELFRRWLIQGGLDSAGANLPVPTGSA